MEQCTAIVLAAGQGKRMNTDVRKQYLLIQDKPVLWYALEAFEKSFVQKVVLVVSEDDIAYVKTEIVEKYHFQKVSSIVKGGRERYHSVACGIAAAGACDYIFIHDGARPFVDEEMLERLLQDVRLYEACVAGMPVKDTIKIANKDGFAQTTPDRNLVWQVQTPQVFSYALIKEAYQTLLREEENLLNRGIKITDDAMVVETFSEHPVKLTEGSYHNVKITTPEDLVFASEYAKNLRFRNL